MKLKQLIYFLIISSLTALNYSCSKKDLPEIPYENSPVFNVTGTINNSAIDLHAGENNAFMLAKLEEFNGIPLFTGQLSNGETSMIIHIYDANTDIPTLSGNFIEKQNYVISEQYGSTPLLKISIDDFSNSSEIEHIIWTIEGVQQTSSTLMIYEPGKYNICAELVFTNGEEAKTCNSIIVGYKNNADFSINWDIIQNYTISAFVESPSNTIKTVKWFVDDVLQSDSIELTLNNISERFTLKAEVEFQNGVVSKREVFINKSLSYYNIEDFTLIGQKTALKWDTSVSFSIINEGKIYQSINDVNSSFIINDISDYGTNADGTKVKLLKGQLNSLFSNQTTGAIVNGSFQIEIGIGY